MFWEKRKRNKINRSSSLKNFQQFVIYLEGSRNGYTKNITNTSIKMIKERAGN